MHVLFLSTWFPYPPDNGSKLRVYYLLRALAHAHEVSLLAFTFSTARPEAAPALNTWCKEINTVNLDPFAANRAGALRTFLSPRPMASRPISAMQRAVTHALERSFFDAVISSTGMMADYALQAPQQTALILEEHNAMPRWAWERYQQAANRLQRARAWLSWRKSRAYEKRLYRKFDLVTMVSELDRQVAAELLGGKSPSVKVVSNGVDCERNRLELTSRRPKTLVFNGSLTYSANYDAMHWFLAEVWPRIRAQTPGVTLTITGSAAGVDLIALALDDSVRLTGHVDDVRIPVAEAAVAIAPIRQGGGTRLKILEAMALGTPVVATAKGAEGLDVVDGEHLLLADDPQHFADQTATLLNDTPLCNQIAANARCLVEAKYDWRQIGQKFVGLVEHATKQGPATKLP